MCSCEPPVVSLPAFGAILQGSLFGLVGQLPQKYSAVFMSGQGLAGAFAAIAMLLAIASESHTVLSLSVAFTHACKHKQPIPTPLLPSNNQMVPNNPRKDGVTRRGFGESFDWI